MAGSLGTHCPGRDLTESTGHSCRKCFILGTSRLRSYFRGPDTEKSTKGAMYGFKMSLVSYGFSAGSVRAWRLLEELTYARQHTIRGEING
jgi:hypothetical protein